MSHRNIQRFNAHDTRFEHNLGYYPGQATAGAMIFPRDNAAVSTARAVTAPARLEWSVGIAVIPAERSTP